MYPINDTPTYSIQLYIIVIIDISTILNRYIIYCHNISLIKTFQIYIEYIYIYIFNNSSHIVI